MPANARLQIAVVDDIEQDRVQIADMTKEILLGAKIPHSIDRYADGRSLLDHIRSGSKYNLLILDVMMDEMDGMELADELHRQGNHTTIIFISVNREMALYGYERDAVRYLAKPLERAKLEEALMRCYALWQERKEILLSTNQGQYRTSFADIQFVEAFDRGTRFYFASKTVECRMKFAEAEAWLPKPLFLCCHRAFIVNLSHVCAIRNYEFALHNGKIVPISKNRYGEIYKNFVDYIAT